MVAEEVPFPLPATAPPTVSGATLPPTAPPMVADEAPDALFNIPWAVAASFGQLVITLYKAAVLQFFRYRHM